MNFLGQSEVFLNVKEGGAYSNHLALKDAALFCLIFSKLSSFHSLLYLLIHLYILFLRLFSLSLMSNFLLSSRLVD
jgi:hypothetical protein